MSSIPSSHLFSTVVENYTKYEINLAPSFEVDSEASEVEDPSSGEDESDKGYDIREEVIIEWDGHPVFSPCNSDTPFTMLTPSKVSFHPVCHPEGFIKVTAENARHESSSEFLFVPAEGRVLKIYEEDKRNQVSFYLGQPHQKFTLDEKEILSITKDNEDLRILRIRTEASLFDAIRRTRKSEALYRIFDQACWQQNEKYTQAILNDNCRYHCYPSLPGESPTPRQALHQLLKLKPLSKLLSKKNIEMFSNRHGCALLDLKDGQGQVFFVSAIGEISKRTISKKPELPILCTEFSILKTVGYWNTPHHFKVLFPVKSCPFMPHTLEQIYTDEITSFMFFDGEFADKQTHEKICEIVMEPFQLLLKQQHQLNLHFTFT